MVFGVSVKLKESSFKPEEMNVETNANTNQFQAIETQSTQPIYLVPAQPTAEIPAMPTTPPPTHGDSIFWTIIALSVLVRAIVGSNPIAPQTPPSQLTQGDR